MEAHSTSRTNLKTNAFGVPSILFFVFSAQAPLTGIVGASALTIALGAGAGTPGIYLAVGAAIILFAVGFTTITRCINTRGGFFAVVRAGLGQRVGTGCSMLALQSYDTIQFAMYGLLGASISSLLANELSIHISWWVGALVCIAIVWVLGSFNIDFGAKVLAVLVSIEFLLLIAFAFGVLFRVGVSGLNVPASFGLHAVLAGPPGVGIMFAIASMFGFESTAIYAPEARDPEKTVPRATYISVSIIALFFTFVIWMIVSYYGAANAVSTATKSLAGDPSQFVLAPMTDILGKWASTTSQVLLCSSLFAGVLAFHNMVARYFHALGEDRIFPAQIAHTNRWHAPWVASATQTVLAVATVIIFAANALDPVTTLFTWFSGLSVLALVVLYVVTSIAIVAYFRRNTLPYRRWNTAVAPALSIVAMAGILYAVLSNFNSLIGSSGTLMWSLNVSVPIAAAIGVALGRDRLTTPHVAEVVDTTIIPVD